MSALHEALDRIIANPYDYEGCDADIALVRAAIDRVEVIDGTDFRGDGTDLRRILAAHLRESAPSPNPVTS